MRKRGNFTVVINFLRNIRTYLPLSVLVRKQLTYPEFHFENEAKDDYSTGLHETRAFTVRTDVYNLNACVVWAIKCL